MKKKYIIIAAVALPVLLLLVYLIIGFNQKLQVTHYTYADSNLPVEFDGYKIVVISDLHCTSFGKKNTTLVSQIQKLEPDIVVLTGDIIDTVHSDYSALDNLLAGICPTFPVYAITGNHEFLSWTVQYLVKEISDKYGVIDLDNNTTTLYRGEASISLTGVAGDKDIQKSADLPEPTDESPFRILLYHYANRFDAVSEYGFNLVLSGHAHGGIIRLPFIGGILGNDEVLFPKYTAGIYHKNGSTMIVSRGLGNSNSIPRFYNRPELVCVTLKCK